MYEGQYVIKPVSKSFRVSDYCKIIYQGIEGLITSDRIIPLSVPDDMYRYEMYGSIEPDPLNTVYYITENTELIIAKGSIFCGTLIMKQKLNLSPLVKFNVYGNYSNETKFIDAMVYDPNTTLLTTTLADRMVIGNETINGMDIEREGNSIINSSIRIVNWRE